MNEDRPVLSATELLRTESTFQRCIDYVDIAGRSSAICVVCNIPKAVARLPMHALARFSCFILDISTGIKLYLCIIVLTCAEHLEFIFSSISTDGELRQLDATNADRFPQTLLPLVDDMLI